MPGPYRMIKVPADDECLLVDMQWSTLENLQAEVGGYVRPTVIGDPVTRQGFFDVRMLVDEDGSFKAELPYNRRASYIYGEPVTGQKIVGDVVIVGDRGMGDWESVPEGMLGELNELFRTRLT
jgi:hypothetical protein